MLKNRVILIMVCVVVYFGIVIGPSVAQETEEPKDDIKYQEPYFYILGPEDVIQITVWGHHELSGKVTVAPDGTIALPLTQDSIKIEGLTREKVTGELIRVMDKYVKHPRVTVSIVGYNSKVYYVLGDVGRPGKFPMKKSVIKLREAIINAGLRRGPGGSASLRRVHVITPDPEKPTCKVINASRILYKGKLKDNISLKPGDVVYVPRNVLDKTSDILRWIFGPAREFRAVQSDVWIAE